MLRNIIIVLGLMLMSCNVKNRIQVNGINFQLFAVDTTEFEDQCYVYRDLSTNLNNHVIGVSIWFEIEFVADGTEKSELFSYRPEGGGGPLSEMSEMKILLSDASSPQINLNSFLLNDSSYFMYKNYCTHSKLLTGYTSQVECGDPNFHNCWCDCSLIYSDISHFIKSFNNNDLSVRHDELKTPIHFFIDDPVLIQKIIEYDSLTIKLEFADSVEFVKSIPIL